MNYNGARFNKCIPAEGEGGGVQDNISLPAMRVMERPTGVGKLPSVSQVIR